MSFDGSTLALCALFGAAAFLYASVGHAGASGYLAAMALVGVAPETMRPTALALNVVVASLATWRFWKAGFLQWRRLWPFLVGSVPFAYAGGSLNVPAQWFKPMLGLILFYAAWVLFRTPVSRSGEEPQDHLPPLRGALPVGAGIGFLSGVTGTGGGIFLSPLLLAQTWAQTRTAAGVSAAFILANSLAGLAGRMSASQFLPPELPAYVAAVAAGGFWGARLGSTWFGTRTLRRLLAVVLAIAGAKLLAPVFSGV